MELKGEDLSCYLNNIQSVGLRKCLYDHYLAYKTYFSDMWKKHLSEFYPQDSGESQLARKSRHCQPRCRSNVTFQWPTNLQSFRRSPWWSRAWPLRRAPGSGVARVGSDPRRSRPVCRGSSRRVRPAPRLTSPRPVDPRVTLLDLDHYYRHQMHIGRTSFGWTAVRSYEVC